jgi:hypothetical protein
MMNLFGKHKIEQPLRTLLLLLAASCQPTSIPRQDTPEQAPAVEQSETKQSEIPSDAAKIPEAKPLPSAEALKPAIPRWLPESIIGAPEKDLASRRLEYNTTIRTRTSDTSNGMAWYFRRSSAGAIVGFEFSNHGGNRILPPRRDAAKNQFYTRDFQFRFDERARQDIHLLVTDWAPSRDRQFRLSELMHSLMYFSPRSFLPAIVDVAETHLITLPTGEEVEFNAETHEIAGGALSESAVDLNPDRNARKFPAIGYNGKGVVVRSNARGADPRLSATATIATGSPAAACDKGISCSQCQLPARELWDQSGAVRFKFPTDQEFDRFLLARCQFGLPKNETGYALTMPK